MNALSDEGQPEFPCAQTRIPSEMSQLAAARAFVRDFCVQEAQGALHEDGIAQLELAVTEALSNIIRYAYVGRADQIIDIEVKTTSEGVAIRLHHEGMPFDPDTAAPPVFDGSQEGGLGVYIIENTVDAVQYAQDQNDKNTIHIYKRLLPHDED